jgi:hypothetical protein
MTDRLESELRVALRDRAARVPAASASRLTQIDYQPRTRSVRPRLAIGALAGAAGTAGTVAAVVSLGAGASNAFAGWTPAPTPPSPQQIADATAACQAKQAPGSAASARQSPIAGLPLKLTDTRGPFTFSVYADADSSAICISGPSFTSISGSSASSPVTVPAGKVTLSTSHLTNRDGQAYAFADGHSGDGVSAVTLILDDGTKVQASTANGWFVAWWPGAHEVKAADVTTPAGVATQTFDLSHASPCHINLCTGGAIGVNRDGPVTGKAGDGAGYSGFSSSGGASSGQGGRVERFSVTR